MDSFMKTIEWIDRRVRIIDQTQLPHKLKFIYLRSVRDVVEAIKSMKVRGAPVIGVAAAYGIVLGYPKLKQTAKVLIASRPTANSIAWAVKRMLKVKGGRAELLREAQRIAREDVEINRRIGKNGSKLIKSGMTVLTHCNAGALATVDYGTALGVIRAAKAQGKRFKVMATETRPLLQGARLTAWELKRLRIPFRLITDSMAGHFMQRGEVDLVVVGADRIAQNLDVANKIGTYSLAVLVKENGVPFYVAAPFSVIDKSIRTGNDIPIEQRSKEEVLSFAGKRSAPKGIRAANPAFDVTPHNYITGIITEKEIMHVSKKS
jgi:methylthioribose-1-phosphate isomerase